MPISKSQFIKHLIRIIMLVSIFPLIGIGILMYETYNGVEILKEEYNRNLNDIEWMYIVKVIDADKSRAQELSNYVKSRMVTEITKAYGGNNEQLKADMANLSGDTKLSSIASDAIKNVYMNVDNDNNTCIISNRHGILADRRVGYSTKSKTWENIIEENPNKDLNRQFIYSVTMNIVKPSKTVFYQIRSSEPTDNPVTKMSLDELKKVYVRYGLEEMKKYNIVVFSYIYDDADMFGTPFINTHGKYQDNDRIVIAQEFNVYDAVESHSTVFLNYIKEYRANHKVDLVSLRVNYVTYGFILSMIFFSLIAIVGICLKSGLIERG